MKLDLSTQQTFIEFLPTRGPPAPLHQAGGLVRTQTNKHAIMTKWGMCMTGRWRRLQEHAEGRLPPDGTAKKLPRSEVSWTLEELHAIWRQYTCEATKTPSRVNPNSVSKWESTSRSRCGRWLSYHCPYITHGLATSYPKLHNRFPVPFISKYILLAPVLFHYLHLLPAMKHYNSTQWGPIWEIVW